MKLSGNAHAPDLAWAGSAVSHFTVVQSRQFPSETSRMYIGATCHSDKNDMR